MRMPRTWSSSRVHSHQMGCMACVSTCYRLRVVLCWWTSHAPASPDECACVSCVVSDQTEDLLRLAKWSEQFASFSIFSDSLIMLVHSSSFYKLFALLFTLMHIPLNNNSSAFINHRRPAWTCPTPAVPAPAPHAQARWSLVPWTRATRAFWMRTSRARASC